MRIQCVTVVLELQHYMADNVEPTVQSLLMISTRTVLNWYKCCQLLSICAHPSVLYHPVPLISFIQPSDTLRWLSSRPVGVERPICGLILFQRRAVNTHFCGCQFGEGRQPCGTQRHISSIPSSGNRAGFQAVRATLFLYSPPQPPGNNSQPATYRFGIMFCVICYFFFLFESTCLCCAHVGKHVTVRVVFLLLLFLIVYVCLYTCCIVQPNTVQLYLQKLKLTKIQRTFMVSFLKVIKDFIVIYFEY